MSWHSVLRRWFAPLAIACLCANSVAGQAEYTQARSQYVDQVAFLIRQKLDVRFARDVDHEAVFALHFSPEGKYQSFTLEERSGDPGFDTALESALRRSATVIPPAPVPPGSSSPFSIRIRTR
jgi:hypothetical protein